MVDLQVTEHGPDARVVTVTGEVDALTAPELAAFLTAQLAVAQLVVVNLDGVRFLDSAGLSVLFPPLAILVIAGLIALLIGGRRRSGEKYAGLRILR